MLAIVTGPASAVLQCERLALNLLARCSTITSHARHLASLTSARLAATRKTTPGFRLVEKYALIVAGVDTHRLSSTHCVMIKDNHIDVCGLETAVRNARSLASFTVKIEVECRNISDAITAIKSGADVVMLDNFIPSEQEISDLKLLNPLVLIEISGGINVNNISKYPSNVILSLGALTHSLPPLLDFSLKIIK